MSDDIQDSELIYELEADPPPAEKFFVDYNGLNLRVAPLAQGGSKSWRFRYNKTSKSLGKYGEVEFKIDPKSQGYVKVDRIFFNFAGKFNPAKGDLVFSQTGELLGIMVNNKYCLVIEDATPAGAIMFGKNDSRGFAKILSNMQKLVASKPFGLR